MIKSKKEKMEKDKQKHETGEFEIPIGGEEAEETSAETTADENGSQELENKISSLKDQLLRKAAEFENYKRRTEAEKADYYGYANEKLIKELLPVLDDFSRALGAYDDNSDGESLRKGIGLVNDKLRKVLEKQGLKEMESTGKDFDVNLHEALMQQPSGDIEPNKVIDTIEKGYSLKDKVIRHAKVIVSSKPE